MPDEPMRVTIYHNPACGTSRTVLALLREHGIEPVIVPYLKQPPSRAELVALAARAGVPVRAWVREKEAPFTTLGLDAPGVTEARLLDAIEAHPVLLNRPIVATAAGVALCRPAERVLALLG